MTKKYSVLNQFIEIRDFNGVFPIIEDGWKKFQESFTDDFKRDVCLYIEKNIEIGGYYGVRYFNNHQKNLRHIFFSDLSKNWILYTVDDSYTELFLEGSGQLGEMAFQELFMAGFYSYVSLNQTLLMHASAIEYKGQSIVFTAASGTGKTTQAELWHNYRDALILNGDKVFLKQEEDGIHAWGSPWSGSSPYAENKSAPLRAIVVLEQAPKNSIRKLTGLEVMEKVFPHVFFPKWDERCENAVMGFLDQVIKNTEIYLLACRPDEEAVALVEQTLFSEE